MPVDGKEKVVREPDVMSDLIALRQRWSIDAAPMRRRPDPGRERHAIVRELGLPAWGAEGKPGFLLLDRVMSPYMERTSRPISRSAPSTVSNTYNAQGQTSGEVLAGQEADDPTGG